MRSKMTFTAWASYYLATALLIFALFSASSPSLLSFRVAPNILATMQQCFQEGTSTQCYQKAAEDFLSSYQLAAILAVFKAHETEPEIFSRCHQVAHFLGQERYHQLKSVRGVFLEGDYICLGGIFHGALEGYFMEKGLLDNPDFDKISTEVGKICGQREDYDKPQQFIECLHGLGHAVMFITDNDLLQGLKLCDALGSPYQDYCYTGALMQNADSIGDVDHPSKYARADDPLYPCYILEQKYQRQCYTYGALTTTQGDVLKSAAVCRQVPEELQHECFQTIGRDRTVVKAEPVDIKMECDQITETGYRNDCIEGAAYNLVVRFGVTSPLPRQFCAIVDSTYQHACFVRIGDALRNLTRDPNQVVEECQKISSPEWQNACLKK